MITMSTLTGTTMRPPFLPTPPVPHHIAMAPARVAVMSPAIDATTAPCPTAATRLPPPQLIHPPPQTLPMHPLAPFTPKNAPSPSAKSISSLHPPQPVGFGVS